MLNKIKPISCKIISFYKSKAVKLLEHSFLFRQKVDFLKQKRRKTSNKLYEVPSNSYVSY